jgi:hypothetical protein
VIQLARRVQRLEAKLTDGTGLRPHSPEWKARWEAKLSRIVSGEDPGEPGAISLEVWDAIAD